jgi:hypothetical protein
MSSSKSPTVFGIREHEAGQVVLVPFDLSSQVRHVHQPALVGVYWHGPVAAARRRGGVGPVRRRRDDHHLAVSLPVVLVVRTDQHQAEQFAVRARRGLQRDGVHPQDRGQVLLHRVDHFERPWTVSLRTGRGGCARTRACSRPRR